VNFDHAPESRNLAATLREVLDGHETVKLARQQLDHPALFQRDLWNALVHDGWTTLLLPEKLGGAGVSLVDASLAIREIGRALVPLPYLETAVAATTLLDRAAQAGAAITELSEAVLNGAVWSVAWPESFAAADGRWLPTSRYYAPFGRSADVVLVPQRTSTGLSIVLLSASDLADVEPAGIDSSFPVIEVESPLDRGRLVLEGADGLAVYQAMMEVSLAAWSLWAVGGMQRTVEMACDHARTRHQFGVPIGSFQAVKHHAANMAIETLQAEVLSDAALCAVMEQADDRRVALARAAAATRDGYYAVASLGLQLHGGIGFTWEADPHLFFRAAVRHLSFLDTAANFRTVVYEALRQQPAASFSRWL
jgi:alkylation response protein AidB-like acyl-CoA dehydrogenase